MFFKKRKENNSVMKIILFDSINITKIFFTDAIFERVAFQIN